MSVSVAKSPQNGEKCLGVQCVQRAEAVCGWLAGSNRRSQLSCANGSINSGVSSFAVLSLELTG